MRSYRSPEAQEVAENSRETKDRFPLDQKLRQFGFVIVTRPKNGKALWKRGGEMFCQDRALDLIMEEIRSVVRSKC